MTHISLERFLATGDHRRFRGPLAMIFVEDLIEVDTTLRHHLDLGFREVVLFAPPELILPRDLAETVHRVAYNYTSQNAFDQINRMIAAAPGLWMYYCYNAEYLFFPFCESRSIHEMTVFMAEERRDAVLTYVVDLYAADLNRYHTAVSLSDAYLDKSGYYAQSRDGAGGPKERQLDFFGGLRWRFEEHVPPSKRRIDRIGIFKAVKGLKILPNHVFNVEEYNTFACPWHNNLTAAVCSFRTAKALKMNPGSTFDIPSFEWRNSTKFDWHSQQLMELGLMEPGQWF
ncbi:MAG: hypothetical protein AAF982_01015 [Pseudomonadota bacterium]